MAFLANMHLEALASRPSGQITILYNDHHVYSRPSVLKQDRVLAAVVHGSALLISLRQMFEQMGAAVSYDAASRTVDVSKAGADVKIAVGKPAVIINGETRPLDVPPIMYHGIVLVPLRVISEGMGAYVLWIPERHVVVVRYIPAAQARQEGLPLPLSTSTPPAAPTPTATPPSAPPPPPTPTPVGPPLAPSESTVAPWNPFTWYGTYVGLNLGGIQNSDTGLTTCTNVSNTTLPPIGTYGGGCWKPTFGHTLAGPAFLGGVQAGWNVQLGRLIVGPEFEYDGAQLSRSINFTGTMSNIAAPNTSGTFTASETMTSLSSERLRIGIPVFRASCDTTEDPCLPIRKTMVYVAGGWAQAKWFLSSDYEFKIPTTVSYASTVGAYQTGWAEGIGIEHLLTPTITARVEAMSYTLRPYEVSSTAFPACTASCYTRGKYFYFQGVMIRLGFNWKF